MKGFKKMTTLQRHRRLRARHRYERACGQVAKAEWGTERWNAIGERQAAIMELMDLSTYRVFMSERFVLAPDLRQRMERAQTSLDKRLQKFEHDGKDVTQMTEIYHMAGSLNLRVIVEVDGQLYSWKTFDVNQWKTDKRLKGGQTE